MKYVRQSGSWRTLAGALTEPTSIDRRRLEAQVRHLS
jgi:hypothetical protein